MPVAINSTNQISNKKAQTLSNTLKYEFFAPVQTLINTKQYRQLKTSNSSQYVPIPCARVDILAEIGDGIHFSKTGGGG